MILHTVNKSPFSDRSFIECLRFCTNNCAILLLEDGVYAGQLNTEFSGMINQYPDINFYALAADVTARGLQTTLHHNIKIIDDAAFVELVVNHHSVQSWY